MQSAITVDPAKIIEKIKDLEKQAKELNGLLLGLDMLRAFEAESVSNGNGRGRPSIDNTLIQKLRVFVEGHPKDFTHKELKEAIGNPSRRDRVRDAIQSLVDDGLLEVVKKPMGREPGLYRPLKNKDRGDVE